MADDDKTGTIPPTVEPPKVDPPKVIDWEAETEKWKGFSRKHEDEKKAALKKIADMESATMTDAEKLIAQGKSEAMKGVGELLAAAEMRTAAAKAGVELPDMSVLNMSKFIEDSGSPNLDAISTFISSLGKGKTLFADPKDLGIGATGRTEKIKQYTREDLKGMPHADVVKARIDGHLDKLLGIND